MSPQVAKAKVYGSLNLYKRLIRYLKPYAALFGVSLVCMIIFGALDGVVPFLVKQVLDGVFANKDRTLLNALPVILIAFALVRAASDFGQQYLMATVGHNVVRDIRNDFQRHVLKLSPEFFVRRSTGDLLARITSDVVMLRSLLTDSLAAIIRDSIRIVALLISAVYLDPALAAMAVILFPIGIFPVYRFGKKMRRLSKRGQEAIGSLSTLMQESVLGNQVVKIFAREKFEEQRFVNENDRLTETFVRSEKVRASTGPINEVLASFAISGVLLYGGYSVMNGSRSQGDFIAFLIAVFLLYDPYKKLSKIHNNIQQALSASERIFEILDTEPTIQEAVNPVPLNKSNEIRLEQVVFRYPDADAIALNNASLTIPEGKKVALVGFSGSGKSTLISLIPRFSDPESGRVLIGGIDVREVSLAALRSRIALVGQHTFLFNDTLFHNIAYGKEGATMAQVEEAAQAAFALDFIRALPMGFNTVVGEGGFSLSGGERQRIAIARAILKDAPILILDEATASLDNRSEREVQDALELLERGRTTIVVAHRLSTIRSADQIVVLNDGRIVETGTHQELVGRGGEYAHLYSLQFRDKDNSQDTPAIN